jgi:hypothetical protein
MTWILSVALAASPSPWSSLGLPPSLQRVLDTGAFIGTPNGFKAIALSHLADGCRWQAMAHPERAEAATACVQAAFSRSLELFPEHCALVDGTRRCDSAALLEHENPLALEHLLLVMGSADALGRCPDEALHRRLAEGLSRQSVNDPYGIVPSYRHLSLRWPADQSALLAALARADAAHGTHLAPPATERFFSVIDAQGLHSSGLPKSELTGKGPGAGSPRGCAQSFISRYLAEVEPARTAAWWTTYKKRFFVELPFEISGFREWPSGVSGVTDADSGPIILGIGTAASALAISAAKAQGDSSLARRLELSAGRVESLGFGASVLHATFADAIRFEGRWHPLAQVK